MKDNKNTTENTLSAEELIDFGIIRFGIMCSGTRFTAWQAACLQKILNLGYTKPALLIIDKDTQGSPSTWKTKKLGQLELGNALWYAFNQLFGNHRARAVSHVDLSSILGQVPSIVCKVIEKGKYSQYFTEDDIHKIREYNLDFILRFGFGIIRGEVLNAARFGVWSFHHDDEEKYRGGPPCFWEIYKGDNVTSAILQRLTDRLDAGIVLKKGYFKTAKTSLARNVDTILFRSADWPAQVCIDIRNNVAHYLDALPTNTIAPIFHNPSNLQMLLFFIKVIGNILKELYNKLLFFDEWGIGIVDKPVNVFLTPGVRPRVQWLPALPSIKYAADPFAVQQGDSLYILFEEFDYRLSKGCISTTQIPQTSIVQSKVAINEPFHMSYPYLFRYEGEIYCIPETYNVKQVRLYKAKHFPESWVLVGTLIEGVATVDNTIFQHNGLWWLFATDGDGGNNFMLKVWYADNLFGPWKPHANNPVKVDICSARSAGTPFIHNGNLYRPSQDSSKTYGHRIVINRIVRLTTTEFEEEQVGVIEPYQNSKYPSGLHTLCAAGNMTVIDGLRHVFVGKNPVVLMLKVKTMLSRKRQQIAIKILK